MPPKDNSLTGPLHLRAHATRPLLLLNIATCDYTALPPLHHAHHHLLPPNTSTPITRTPRPHTTQPTQQSQPGLNTDSPSLKPFLKRRGRSLRYLMRPLPVVLRRIAFWPHWTAGGKDSAHVGGQGRQGEGGAEKETQTHERERRAATGGRESATCGEARGQLCMCDVQQAGRLAWAR